MGVENLSDMLFRPFSTSCLITRNTLTGFQHMVPVLVVQEHWT